MKKKTLRLFLFGIFLIGLNTDCIFAQQMQDSVVIHPQKIKTKQIIIVSAIAIDQALSFYIEYQWWWKGNYHPFELEPIETENYSYSIDKVGHFYTSYLYYHAINEIMKYGEFSKRTRTITSIAIPFTYALSIELGDGYSRYNFSFFDLASNSLGICYGVLQDRFKYLKNINVKFSYFPSQKYFENQFKRWSLTEDYDGHIYWLTFNVHHLLPKNMKKNWPEFLNTAIGYGVNNFGSNIPLQREFFIGFDYNLDAIQTKNKAIKSAINIIDKFHFPAPGFKKTGDDNFTPKWLLLN